MASFSIGGRIFDGTTRRRRRELASRLNANGQQQLTPLSLALTLLPLNRTLPSLSLCRRGCGHVESGPAASEPVVVVVFFTRQITK